jgi:hypothetical protein
VRGVKIPVAVSAFPDEIYRAPRCWAERAYPKLIYYNKPAKGGHFAAWEQPRLLSADLRAGFRPLRDVARRKRRVGAGSDPVLVVTAPPRARLVAPFGGAIEPLPHAPETIEPPRIGGVGMVDGPVLVDECAHTWPFA